MISSLTIEDIKLWELPMLGGQSTGREKDMVESLSLAASVLPSPGGANMQMGPSTDSIKPYLLDKLEEKIISGAPLAHR